jgi:hypothetical protein
VKGGIGTDGWKLWFGDAATEFGNELVEGRYRCCGRLAFMVAAAAAAAAAAADERAAGVMGVGR